MTPTEHLMLDAYAAYLKARVTLVRAWIGLRRLWMPEPALVVGQRWATPTSTRTIRRINADGVWFDEEFTHAGKFYCTDWEHQEAARWRQWAYMNGAKPLPAPPATVPETAGDER